MFPDFPGKIASTPGGIAMATFAVCYIPVFFKHYNFYRANGRPISNVDPRTDVLKTPAGGDKKERGGPMRRVAWAQAAHCNLLEMAGPVVGALALASAAGQGARAVELGNWYAFFAAGYAVVYSTGLNKLAMGMVRSLFFFGRVAALVGIFLLAAQ
eukprot:TRINITY_DN12415_c0_g8_i1.p2 TRINITY_DN12415_c0_g8~~TRINITY_DN12415_c0_g8_i1.p2  ORF type:complete len:156 (+),score=45.54 TRINITY_DN12415_c0_g8_i1:58-525(+)